MTQATNPNAPIAGHLPPQWQDWIAENLTRGCREADMVKIMVDNGFEASFANSAIAVIRDMASRVSETALPLAVGPVYECPPSRLAPLSQIDTSDRCLDIGFAISDPNIALIENLLSPAECEELIEQSRGKLKRSEVVNRVTGDFEVNDVRSSEGTYFARSETPTISAIEARIAALTGVPADHGEPLQILHYGVGGEYLPHQDFFEPADSGSSVHMQAGGQRIATLVIYLNTVPEGGGTGFPKLKLMVNARQGSAVYFEYTNPQGQLDARCLHAGTPVAKGEKWIATKWLRERPYVRSN